MKKLEDSEDSSLEALSQAATTAEHDFINANNSYFSTERSVQQQLETMAGTVEKLKATSGNAPARMELEHARQGLKDYTITAPISGTISTLSVTEGDLASTTAPVAVISGNDAMVIRIKIDEYSVLNAEAGKNVKIFIESIGETYDGTLRYVSDTAEITEGVSYYNAEVSFVPDDKVRSGMSTEVRLMIVDEHDVKCLPAEALYYRPDGSAYVYLWSGSELEERDIKIGVSDGDYVQVLEGIGEEDTVYFTYRTVNTDDSVIVLE